MKTIVKRKYPQIKVRKNFMRNFFVMYKFMSQDYTIISILLFDNTVFVKSAKGYIGVFRGLQCKRKYP